MVQQTQADIASGKAITGCSSQINWIKKEPGRVKAAKKMASSAKKSKMRNAIIEHFGAQMDLIFSEKDTVDGPTLFQAFVHMVAQYAAATGKNITPFAPSFAEASEAFQTGIGNSSSSLGSVPKAASQSQQGAGANLARAGAEAANVAAKTKQAAPIPSVVLTDEVVQIEDDERMSRPAQKG